jgi:hypothetical protein
MRLTALPHFCAAFSTASDPWMAGSSRSRTLSCGWSTKGDAECRMAVTSPSSAASYDSVLVMSGTTAYEMRSLCSGNWAAIICADASVRTVARTLKPWHSADLIMLPPKKPLPPVIRTVPLEEEDDMLLDKGLSWDTD